MVEYSHTQGQKRSSSFTVNMLFVLFAFTGLALVTKLTVKLNPGRQPGTLTVAFTYPGAAPQVVEHEVTSVLEGAMAAMGGIRQIESNSSFGYGNITVEAEAGANIETLRFQILSIIKDVWQHFPEEVGYPGISTGSEQNNDKQLLISYTLNGNASAHSLKEYADKKIRKTFSRVKDISGVETFGATPYEWKFVYNSEQLKLYGLSPYQLAGVLNQWQQTTGLGITGNSEAGTVALATPVSAAFSGQAPLEIVWKDIPVTEVNGKIVTLKDVAELEITEQQPGSYFRINGKNTVSVNIYASPLSNQLALADAIYKEEQKILAQLPEGWALIKMYDSSEYLRKEINKTTQRLAAAILLLFLFVLLVQRSWRYLLLIIVSLTVNISIAFIFYYIFNVEIHLVSIAGITVSIGIIIDNYIVMANYLMHRKSLHVFMAMLGATLTTLGALVVIFFLDEADRANLIDFAWVTIINLAVSLVVALWFIPSLMAGLGIKQSKKITIKKRLRRIVAANRFYEACILFINRWKTVFIIALILAFGIPFQLLPGKIEKETFLARVYNSTLGSNFYNEHLRIPLDKYAGGTLRPFMQHISGRSSYYRPSGETTLYIRVSLPTGTTINQLNEVCLKMESYLNSFQGIRQFQTYVNSPQNASIIVYFTREALNSAMPAEIKSFMIQKANEYAGADFGIFMRNETFSNELTEGWRTSQIQLSGYDYRQLVMLARQLSDTLSLNPRIKDIAVFSGNDIWLQSSTIEERGLTIDKSKLAAAGLGYTEYVSAMRQYHAGSTAQIMIVAENGYTPVSFYAGDMSDFDFWQFMHTAIGNDSVKLRPSETARLNQLRVDGNIYKKNQSYLIRLAYNFIGPDELARRVLERETGKLNARLPLGFKAEIPAYDYSWMFGEKPVQYWLLGLIVLIIWAIGAVLFESLVQPLVIISIIPMSFIGVFFTFFHFEIPFDEGGYASLLLLSGLSVNMIIYILNDLNFLRKQNRRTDIKNYIKAFNLKIVPVLLTTISTIAGLLPFLLFDSGAGFWTAFAAGTIGGLLFAVPLLVIFLPVMIKMNLQERKISNFKTPDPK